MIDKPFAYHKPSKDGLERITTLREGFSTLKQIIEQTVIKGVVFNDPDSEADC
jgi:hypothetical protein